MDRTAGQRSFLALMIHHHTRRTLHSISLPSVSTFIDSVVDNPHLVGFQITPRVSTHPSRAFQSGSQRVTTSSPIPSLRQTAITSNPLSLCSGFSLYICSLYKESRARSALIPSEGHGIATKQQAALLQNRRTPQYSANRYSLYRHLVDCSSRTIKSRQLPL
jgi:hypothetical protein